MSEYYYTLQYRYEATPNWLALTPNWLALIDITFTSPLDSISSLDLILGFFHGNALSVESVPKDSIRIGVFHTEKKKRVDEINLGHMRSLYQVYLHHGSVKSTVESCLLNKSFCVFDPPPVRRKIIIDT